MLKNGRLIIIEGTDGSGKATQLKLLVDYFKRHRISHATLDFPQYYKTFFGRWIGRFLKGEFGQVEDLPPYLLMFPYAADRWQAKPDLERWLVEGKIVVSNRYTGSNAYQAAKLPRNERERFINWSFEMEYEAFGIPKEDLVIFLYVPYDVARSLMKSRQNRKYMGNSNHKDIHEAHEGLMREVEKVYLDFCIRFHHWVKIDCTKNGAILPREEIQQKIIAVLRRKKIIK